MTDRREEGAQLLSVGAVHALPSGYALLLAALDMEGLGERQTAQHDRGQPRI